MSCRDCTSGDEHCHGTLVVHVSGEPECTEPACRFDRDAHEHLIDCVTIEGGCAA